MKKNAVVLIIGPPAFGKTSLLQLIESKLPHVKRIMFNPLHDRTCESIFEGTAGFDLQRPFPPVALGEYHVIAIDEAHTRYGENDQLFWVSLLKRFPTFAANQYGLIICATDYIDGVIGGASPAAFSDFVRFGLTDLRISHEEAIQFCAATIPHRFREMSAAQNILLASAFGNIGMLAMMIKGIIDEFRWKNEHDASEHDVIAFIFSARILESVERCFGLTSRTLQMETSDILSRVLCNNTVQSLSNDRHQMALTRSGILFGNEGNLDFVSHMARRQASKLVFPGRLNEEFPLETPIDHFLASVFSEMSAKAIADAGAPNGRFPKETSWQHLFFSALSSRLPPYVIITPELSHVFPMNENQADRIKGSIDFFIDGRIRWGFELLVNGGGIGEHLDRFRSASEMLNGKVVPKGKYADLNVKDYRVIDIRRHSIHTVEAIAKRTTFWLSQDGAQFKMQDEHGVVTHLKLKS